jgi:hypothetical protein
MNHWKLHFVHGTTPYSGILAPVNDQKFFGQTNETPLAAHMLPSPEKQMMAKGRVFEKDFG